MKAELIIEDPDLKKKREEAHGTIQQIKNLVYQAGLSFIEIGRLLKYVRDGKLYKYAGDGGYDTFTSFIADADISISPSTAYTFIYLYERYVLDLGISEENIATIPWYKLQMLGGKIKPETKEEAEEWMNKAQTLSISDFKAEIAEAKANKEGGVPLVYPRIYKCPNCKMWKVESDQMCKC